MSAPSTSTSPRPEESRVVTRDADGTMVVSEGIRYPQDEAAALADALARSTSAEVRFDHGSRALYATDASNYRQVPIGVVVPRSVDDVAATVALCRDRGAPVLSRGGGTSLAGQCCNTAVVIDFSKYLNRILEIDPERRFARVQPGVVLDTLRDAAERHHLTFGPDPSTHDHNTLGGMIGNNSCGVHSVMAGRTSENVETLDVLTYDGLRMTVGPTSETEFGAIVAAGGRRGEIYRRLDALGRKYARAIRERYPHIPRRVSGYNLEALLPENGFNVARALVGSEGTCVTILEAGLRLVHSPPVRVLVVIGFPDVYRAGDCVPRVMEHRPIGLEGMDQLLVDFMKLKHLGVEDIALLPEGQGWLLAEFGGETEDEAAEKAERLLADLKDGGSITDIKLLRDPVDQRRIWHVRRAGLGATAFVPRHPEAWEGWEDSAVPPERIGDYMRDLKALFHKYGYESVLYGHFGDGCVHCRVNFGLRTEEGIRVWLTFLHEAADLVVRYGGSISGEHGDGQAKAALLDRMFGPEIMAAFREFKAIWDPQGRMNPGKVVDPYPIASNLRVGPSYTPPKVETHFAFPDDHGSFAHAALRCVGVGECRRLTSDEGVMCPSYMVTREEEHVTRGRARMLFEMLHGGPLEAGWKSEPVEEALSLCLACKGCKSDCPVNVDMATYKAEFRSHYYAGRLRPRAAYSMGLVYWWSRLAGRVPGIANFLTRTPGLGALVKLAGGIATERAMPPFAAEPFTRWFARRHRTVNPDGRPLILWPDTFNNFFYPETAIAAVRVLEAAGWRVTIPRKSLCCGRPLYDWGMLPLAKRLLREILDTLGGDIRRGVPVVGLEPACVAAFRDELVNLFPDDDTARRLCRQTYLLSEFLDRHCPNLDLPRLDRKALVQIHCHHHAVIKDDAERRILDRLGLDYEVLPSGCCGMAGSFGFEADKYPLSVKAGERVLLPRVRQADGAALILANGFSCREQIRQGSGRDARHLAEVAADALGLAYVPRPPRGTAVRRGLLIAGGLGLLGVAGLAMFGRGGGPGRRSRRSGARLNSTVSEGSSGRHGPDEGPYGTSTGLRRTRALSGP